jgi:hypothetical protein
MGSRAGAIALAAVIAAALLAGTARAAGVGERPVIPDLQGAVGDHAREIAGRGAELGNRRDVFAKVGDSITESGSFLSDLACDEPAWGDWRDLRPTLRFFGRRTFPGGWTDVWCGNANSFSRASLTAVTGWDASNALGTLDDPPAACDGALAHPLDCEYHLLRPSVALIMYGTNDLERFGVSTFRANLAEIVRRSVHAGVIPVLSTIPPRLDSGELNSRVDEFNRRSAGVAASHDVPLWNYWRSLEGPDMVHHGISDDGVHPNLYGGCTEPLGCRAFDFTGEALRYGYNQRNLGALRVLRRVRRAALSPQ